MVQVSVRVCAGFEYTGLFPPLVLRMLRVGENTGGLDTALLNISYFYDRDVKESMERLETMIGPAMTLVLGGYSVLGHHFRARPDLRHDYADRFLRTDKQ